MKLKIEETISERRQHYRYSVPVKVRLVSTNKTSNLEGLLTTISADGLSVSLPTELQKNTKYKIEIELPDILVSFFFKTIWSKTQDKLLFEYGGKLFSKKDNQFLGFEKYLQSIKVKRISPIQERRSPERRRIKIGGGENKRQSDRRLVNRYLRSNENSKPGRMIQLKRVVVTGLGIISPNGLGKDRFLSSLKNGISGVRKITRFNASPFPVQFAGEIEDTDFKHFLSSPANLNGYHDDGELFARLTKRTDRPVHFLLAASLDALHDSNLDLEKINRNIIGISTGSSSNGLGFAFREFAKYSLEGLNSVHPYTVAASTPNPSSGELAAELQLRGPSTTFSQGCTSGAAAISYAFEQIQRDNATLMLAGGADSPLDEYTFAAFCRSGMLAPCKKNNPSPQPFNKERNGIVLGEGGAMVILEELNHALARKAKIYGEVLSTSSTCDGYDMVKWQWHGQAAARAIKLALEQACIEPDHLSLLYAHGTGSQDGDAMEMRSISSAFGPYSNDLPVTNVKSLIGYSQAACGAIEFVSACLSLEYGLIPGISTFKESEIDLNISAEPRVATINTVLINCFGFGGKNVCLTVGKTEF